MEEESCMLVSLRKTDYVKLIFNNTDELEDIIYKQEGLKTSVFAILKKISEIDNLDEINIMFHSLLSVPNIGILYAKIFLAFCALVFHRKNDEFQNFIIELANESKLLYIIDMNVNPSEEIKKHIENEDTKYIENEDIPNYIRIYSVNCDIYIKQIDEFLKSHKELIFPLLENIDEKIISIISEKYDKKTIHEIKTDIVSRIFIDLDIKEYLISNFENNFNESILSILIELGIDIPKKFIQYYDILKMYSKHWNEFFYYYLKMKFNDTCVFPFNDSIKIICIENKCEYELPSKTEIEYIKECVKREGKRLILLPVLLELENAGVYHRNILIYNFKTNVLERFDPNGDYYKFTYTDMKQVLLLFKHLTNKEDIIFLDTSDFCPQIEAYKNAIDMKEYIAHKGTCQVWSLVYAYLRLYFYNKSREYVIKYMNKNIKNYYVFILKVITMFLEIEVEIGKYLSEEEHIPERYFRKFFKNAPEIINIINEP